MIIVGGGAQSAAGFQPASRLKGGCSHNWLPHRNRKQGIDRDDDLDYIVVKMSRATLGELEHIVLLAILRLGDRAYGVTIADEIRKCTDRDPAPGALYVTLDRLEDKGLVVSRFGDPTPERGGRAKRLFRVEVAGNRALQISDQTIRNMTAGLKGRWGTI